MIKTALTDEQLSHGRIAEGLRELIPHTRDVQIGEVEQEVGPPIPIWWMATNQAEILGWAADLIEELTLRRR